MSCFITANTYVNYIHAFISMTTDSLDVKMYRITLGVITALRSDFEMPPDNYGFQSYSLQPRQPASRHLGRVLSYTK